MLLKNQDFYLARMCMNKDIRLKNPSDKDPYRSTIARHHVVTAALQGIGGPSTSVVVFGPCANHLF